MTTSKEIFDYLVAKYPERKIEVSEKWRSEPKEEPHYFGAYIGDISNWTNETPPNIDAMLAELEAKLPTPEQEREKFLKRQEELTKELAELQSKLTLADAPQT